MSENKHTETKIDGQRRAIREHVSKFERYPDPNDKRFALKTIQRAQGEITSLKRRLSRSSSSWEDSWRAPTGWERR